MDSDSLQIIALIALIACSAFFSGSETAFTCVNKTRIATHIQNGNKRAKKVQKITDNLDKFLTTVFVGNNLVNLSAACLATVAIGRWLGGNFVTGAIISALVLTLLILLFGEIFPKSLAKKRAEGFAFAVSEVVLFLMALLTPITAVLGVWQKLVSRLFEKDDTSTVTEDEIITMVDEAQNDGEIDEHEGELIKNAIDFGDIDVSEILIPRVDIVAIPSDMPFDEIMSTFRKSGFSRLPVYNDTIDNIIGVIHEKDFSRLIQDGKTHLKPIIKKALFINEGTKLSKLLRKLQAEKTHMAIALDEYGGTQGLVTLEDILEILVGEIWDEHDKVVENIREIGENTYVVNGATALTEMEDIYLFSEEVYDEYVTVNGWVLENLQKIPEVKDSFVYDNLSVEVSKVKDRRAEKVKIVVTPKADKQDEEQEKDNIFGFKSI